MENLKSEARQMNEPDDKIAGKRFLNRSFYYDRQLPTASGINYARAFLILRE